MVLSSSSRGCLLSSSSSCSSAGVSSLGSICGQSLGKRPNFFNSTVPMRSSSGRFGRIMTNTFLLLVLSFPETAIHM